MARVKDWEDEDVLAFETDCQHEDRTPLGTLGRTHWERCRYCGLDIPTTETEEVPS